MSLQTTIAIQQIFVVVGPNNRIAHSSDGAPKGCTPGRLYRGIRTNLNGFLYVQLLQGLAKFIVCLYPTHTIICFVGIQSMEWHSTLVYRSLLKQRDTHCDRIDVDITFYVVWNYLSCDCFITFLGSMWCMKFDALKLKRMSCMLMWLFNWPLHST